MAVVIESARDRDPVDRDLSRLLTRAYVEEGFTAPERAAAIFAPAAVRARGEILCAWTGRSLLAGMVVVVSPSSPARRFANDGEAEMHLLATAPECRGTGVGRALVEAAMERARATGARRMLLWTQTTMRAAQRLYASCGFVREPGRDFEENGRRFLFFAADLRDAGR